MLELAADLGLAGVLFELSPFDPFATTTWPRSAGPPKRKGSTWNSAWARSCPGTPWRKKAASLLAEAGCDGDISEAQIVIHHLQVAKKLGSPILRCVAGNLFTRDEGHDMAAMADRV